MATSKKQQILDNALNLFVTQGIHATSTASIAKAATVATGTLFHHFPSKEALVLSLYQSIKQGFAQQISPIIIAADDIKSQAKAVWNESIDWTIANPAQQEFCLLVMQYKPLTNKLKAKVLAEEFGYLNQLIAIGLEQKILADYPLDFLIDHCHGMFMTTSSFFINNPQFSNDENYRNSAFELFWRSIAK